MPIDRIPPSSSLVETMRLLARDRASGNKKVVADPSQGDSTAPRPVRQTAELRQRLHDLAKGVDPTDPQALKEVRVPVLREILLWEFGSDFRQDSQFQPMVESINQALDIDPRFQQRFVQMLAGLKKA